MKKENEVITIYCKDKREKIALLCVSIVFLILIFIILFVAETDPDEGLSVRISGAGFFSIFMIMPFLGFYNSNKSTQNALLIKENGNVFNGKVLHVEESRRSDEHSRTIRRLLIEFFDGNENRLIVSQFPYDIKTNYPTLLNRIDMDEYNYCYNENKVEHIQYNGNGYTTFDNYEDNGKICKYTDSRNKNYEGDLTCRVYEYEGKYVVDDFEGYVKPNRKSENRIAGLIACVCIVFMVIIAIFLFKAIGFDTSNLVFVN